MYMCMYICLYNINNQMFISQLVVSILVYNNHNINKNKQSSLIFAEYVQCNFKNQCVFNVQCEVCIVHCSLFNVYYVRVRVEVFPRSRCLRICFHVCRSLENREPINFKDGGGHEQGGCDDTPECAQVEDERQLFVSFNDRSSSTLYEIEVEVDCNSLRMCI
jgi:hypothetical protein